MDPVTAFSLAVGVLQVIDFSFKALNTCREVYKDGSLAGNRDTEDITEALSIYTILTLSFIPKNVPPASSGLFCAWMEVAYYTFVDRTHI